MIFEIPMSDRSKLQATTEDQPQKPFQEEFWTD